MLQGINLEEVRKYNADLKTYRDKAASINAEIEYTNKEIDALCAELTAELGKPVTRDNIEQIYNEQVEIINSTLQSGNAVLSKIAGEAAQPQVQAVPVTPAAPQTSAPFVQQAVPQATPQASPFVQQAMPQPVQGSVFGGQAATVPTQAGANLPPMFSLS